MPNSTHYDLIVTGAGVLGSFHAYHACRKGLHVLLLEKDNRPSEATVRNFGQVVPSGMKQGQWQEYGRRSLEIYGGIQQQFDISVRNNGTVYIASDEAELALIRELATINHGNDYTSLLLSSKDCQDQYPGLEESYCKGGLFFPQEITVEPNRMIHLLLAYMQEQLKLHYRPATQVQFCDYINGKCIVEDSMGNAWTADNVIVCNGRDFRQLFPLLFNESDIVVSKLQMMKTIPLPGFSIKGSVLSGLSIRRYESFGECPSWQALTTGAPIAPALSKWGIHILFKQATDGSIIIGDSHEYAPAAQQDALGYEIKQEINDCILAEAQRIFNLPSWQIAEYWNGYYAQRPNGDLYAVEAATNVHIITAIGGKGMTAGPGLAEQTINQLF